MLPGPAGELIPQSTPETSGTSITELAARMIESRGRTVVELLRYWATHKPTSPACALDDQVFTFAALEQRAHRLAAGAFALGIRPDDRVATLAPNRVEILELFYGLACAGAIQVPLNAYLKGAFLQHQITDSGARFLITDNDGWNTIQPLLSELPNLEVVILLDQMPSSDRHHRPQLVPYIALCEPDPAAFCPVTVSAHGTMSIVYTSGTTGLPKGCVLSHSYYCRSGRILAAAMELTDDDSLFGALPLFHAGGQLILLMTALHCGISAHLRSSFSASQFLTQAHKAKATVAVGVGAMGAALLASPPSPHDRNHRLRMMMVAPMGPDAQATFQKRFGIEPWTQIYGQTECMPITATAVSWPHRNPTSCGQPAADLHVALIDDDGNEVPDGDVGEICVRKDPAVMFDGYWQAGSTTADSATDPWHRSGDHGRRLANGELAFVDRKKDSLRRRGENISRVELELAINQHPHITESAVHSVPSDLAEDEIRACIVLMEGHTVDPSELFEYFTHHLPYFAIPRYVRIVETLPRNAVGRVMKHLLRDTPLDDATWDFEAFGLALNKNDRRRRPRTESAAPVIEDTRPVSHPSTD